MSIKAVTPYLILNGKAQQAIAFYQRCLGARTDVVQRFGDVDQSCPEGRKDRVMHAQLRVGDAVLLMSDGTDDGPRAEGGSISIALDLDDVEEARRCFDALGATGKVIQPLIAAPWGALFGVVHDELGISWMFNCATKPA